jgi:hypothetical protein
MNNENKPAQKYAPVLVILIRLILLPIHEASRIIHCACVLIAYGRYDAANVWEVTRIRYW